MVLGDEGNPPPVWSTVRRVGAFVCTKAPSPRFLVLEATPEAGRISRPPTADIDGGEQGHALSTVTRLLEALSLDPGGRLPVSLGRRITYYMKETKYVEETFGVEVDGIVEPTLDDGHVSHRWASFEEALRLLTLEGHRKALITLFTETVAPDVDLAVGPMGTFGHLPVDHASGLVVLCDFDGTITEEEASIAVLKAFAGEAWERYERAWLAGDLTTHECLGLQFTIAKAPVEEMARYAAENVALRKGFQRFVEWCRERGHGLVVTSSGMDFYIRAILERHGLGSVEFLANRGVWLQGPGLIIEEGLVNEECDRCGNCKAMLVRFYKGRGARVAFVGDGLTDECPSREADMVFARRSLLEYCRSEGVDCEPFTDFDGIAHRLEENGY